jgi:hypothetical protein
MLLSYPLTDKMPQIPHLLQVPQKKSEHGRFNGRKNPLFRPRPHLEASFTRVLCHLKVLSAPDQCCVHFAIFLGKLKNGRLILRLSVQNANLLRLSGFWAAIGRLLLADT